MGPTSSVQPHSWILQTSEIGQSAWCHHCPGEGRAPPAGMGERCLSAVAGACSPASSTSLPLQQEKAMRSWWRHRRAGYKTNIADTSISQQCPCVSLQWHIFWSRGAGISPARLLRFTQWCNSTCDTRLCCGQRWKSQCFTSLQGEIPQGGTLIVGDMCQSTSNAGMSYARL